MRRSTDKILTTHVGSLPDFVALDPNAPDHEAKLRALVADAVTKQRATGLDIINEGEFAKYGDWLRYAESRLGGCEPRKVASTVFIEGKDREEFAAFYKYATERGTLFYRPNEDLSRGASFFTCTAPITYQGQAAMAREIEVFRAALGEHPPQDAFLTTTAPASLEPYRKNEFYKSEEEFVYAIADVMRTDR
jgi:5-methyltetrahydropteroyltriglutamate--homocysteine methyltransferase